MFPVLKRLPKSYSVSLAQLAYRTKAREVCPAVAQWQPSARCLASTPRVLDELSPAPPTNPPPDIKPVPSETKTGEGHITPPHEGPSEDPDFHKAVIWFENVFPFRMPLLDPRTLLISRWKDSFLLEERWKRFLPSRFPEGSDFKVQNVEPNLKEGGCYMEFKYKGGTVEEALEAIQHHLKKEGIRSYFNFSRVYAHLVKGRPWVEDLVSRVPSSRLHVEFIKGPDLTVESLYREFRMFGRIVDINLQKSTDKEVPRYASVQFLLKRAATSARNCIHGEQFEGTTIAIGYEVNHGWWYQFYNWFMGNLRVSVLLLLGVVGGFSYMVFDPWRVFSITNNITGRYSLSQYTQSASKWWHLLQSVVSDFFFSPPSSTRKDMEENVHRFSEREEQTKLLASYLRQAPESLVLVSGPKGSGKTAFVQDAMLGHTNQLLIKCDELVGKGDYLLISHLSSQVSFFPTFGFAGQLSGFIDSIITATTGAKAGLSTTNEGEVRKILECVTLALRRVTENQQAQRQAKQKRMDATPDVHVHVPEIEFPVVIIDDYLSKENIKEQWIFPILTQWAAQLNEYRIAHVIFVSDHPSAAQNIGKSVPTKTVELFHLADATPAASAAYVRNRIGKELPVASLDRYIDGLGGRLHDLDLFISKIQSGLAPQAAFDDMCHKAVSELRKIGFPEDAGKSGWTSIQFFKIAQILSKQEEVSFDDLVVHPIFGSDPNPILLMERAGLLSIVHFHGRPYSVKPNRPIFREAFKEMVADAKLEAYMGILTNKKLNSDCTKKIQDHEQELDVLGRIAPEKGGGAWVPSGSAGPLQSRQIFLAAQIGLLNDKILAYQAKEDAYKKSLKLSE
ncbi:mitochondrial escape protein 2 [Kappamyces sp. JEL0829]|nr:mitochondrial escape protein 2 [Kappamyces sp. JEL0829]